MPKTTDQTPETPAIDPTPSPTPSTLPADVQASLDYVRKYSAGKSPREQHGAFSYKLAALGWRGGAVISEAKRTHPLLCDWLQLPTEGRNQLAALLK